MLCVMEKNGLQIKNFVPGCLAHETKVRRVSNLKPCGIRTHDGSKPDNNESKILNLNIKFNSQFDKSIFWDLLPLEDSFGST